MAELGSAAPTSGGLYFWTYSLSSPKWRNLLCWIVGYSNTVGSVASATSIDWGCAVQIMASESIGKEGSFSATQAQTFGLLTSIVISHAIICCLALGLWRVAVVVMGGVLFLSHLYYYFPRYGYAWFQGHVSNTGNANTDGQSLYLGDGSVANLVLRK